jgi:hypothetical protein
MLTSFNQWWHRPLRTRDKVGAVFIGAIGGFWVSLLGRLFLGPMPVSFTELGYWVLGGIVAGTILGILFPRVVSVVLFPFTFLGISSN